MGPEQNPGDLDLMAAISLRHPTSSSSLKPHLSELQTRCMNQIVGLRGVATRRRCQAPHSIAPHGNAPQGAMGLIRDDDAVLGKVKRASKNTNSTTPSPSQPTWRALRTTSIAIASRAQPSGSWLPCSIATTDATPTARLPSVRLQPRATTRQSHGEPPSRTSRPRRQASLATRRFLRRPPGTCAG